MMYSLDEIGLIPATISKVKHRGDVSPFTGKNKQYLPVFVSPMTCIVDERNINEFLKNKFLPIIPVSAKYSFTKRAELARKSSGWMAVTLKEFKEWYKIVGDYCRGILIDTANGQMEEIFMLVKECKEVWGNTVRIMIGNIANPETYFECCKAGVDYVRIGIGGGSGCTTSVQTGVHTSIPYILQKIKEGKKLLFDHDTLKFTPFEDWLKKVNGTCTKIVADGGITTISRAIKALALGANYVMMGKAFAQCEDVAQNLQYIYPTNHSGKVRKEALYYGQSSEQGQLDRFGKIKSYPEGTEVWIPVTTTLQDFSYAFESSLRSAMSYCGATTLEKFIGNVKYDIMSKHEFDSFNK